MPEIGAATCQWGDHAAISCAQFAGDAGGRHRLRSRIRQSRPRAGIRGIFARWSREAENYRAETLKAGRAQLGLSYGDTPRQNIDLFLPEAGETRPARHVHSRRLVAFARSVDVQPDGARPQCTRRRGRGRGLRSVPECRHRRHHRADASRLCFSCGSASAGACLFTVIRPAAILPAPWSRPTGRRSIPRRRPIWFRPAIRSPAYSTLRRWSASASTRICG